MKFYTIIFSLLISFQLSAQNSKTQVLTLGTFHFDFPNNDFVQIEKSNQINVLDPEYQKEIIDIVQNIKKFRPTILVIEEQPSNQPKIDSLYQLYLNGQYILQKTEVEQIAFRLAKDLGIKKLYCVDEWGEFNSQVEEALMSGDTSEKKRFTDYYANTGGSILKYNPEQVYKSKGIRAELKKLNDREHIKKSLGNYLIGPFKYESTQGDFFGVNFETGRWFNRNLKIFRNIQRIDTGEEDRIFVLFGADHMNVLNILFESSPEYDLVKTNDYL